MVIHLGQMDPLSLFFWKKNPSSFQSEVTITTNTTKYPTNIQQISNKYPKFPTQQIPNTWRRKNTTWKWKQEIRTFQLGGPINLAEAVSGWLGNGWEWVGNGGKLCQGWRFKLILKIHDGCWFLKHFFFWKNWRGCSGFAESRSVSRNVHGRKN